MKNIFITVIIFLSFNSAHAQKDSLDDRRDSILVRGFYKSYQEFLTNNPSVRLDFSTVLITVSKVDSTIIGAKYEIPDSLDNFGDIWGFCDGKNIFVARGTPFVMKYWKIQCKGPNPYFFYLHKSISIIPTVAGIVASAISTALPPYCDLMFIDKNGRTQNPFRFNLKELFRDNPGLFKQFKHEVDISDDLAIDYIIRYNESKIKN